MLAPLAVMALFWLVVRADPAVGITASNAPYTDEAWDVVNARNLVLLGRWSTDDWNLHLVNLPFSVITAAVFGLAGVGLAQARIISIAATGLTMVALGIGLRGALGARQALLAALAYGCARLVLFYGRLAFLEPSVALWLTLGGLLALRAPGPRSGWWGALAGLALALAVGTKPSAAFAAVGILAGVAVVGFRSREVRRWVAGAAGLVALAGVGWLALVGLPNLAAVQTDLRIWAAEPILSTPGEMLGLITSYPTFSDGFFGLAAPLLAFGAAGLGLVVIGRRRLAPATATLAGAATGWAALGFGLLAVAPYRPNRYELPMLPALAVLGAIGLWTLAARGGSWARWRVPALSVVAALVLVVPGLLWYGRWMRTATYTLAGTQAAVTAAVPPGAVVEGALAPGFAMTAPVVTLVSRPSTDVNPGDLYATRGVRWVIGDTGTAPAWAALQPAAWAARTTVLCVHWGSEDDCVWRLP